MQKLDKFDFIRMKTFMLQMMPSRKLKESQTTEWKEHLQIMYLKKDEQQNMKNSYNFISKRWPN